MKNTVNPSDLIEAWSAKSAQMQSSTCLKEVVVLTQNSITIADVREAFGVSIAVRLVVAHLKDLFYFAEASRQLSVDEVERKISQLMDAATLIVSEFYFLSLPELLSFFRKVKTGEYGQISWGTLGINVQQLFFVMRQFQKDRVNAINQVEREKGMDTLYVRRGDLISNKVQIRISEYKALAKQDIKVFMQLYPIWPGTHTVEVWWRWWRLDINHRGDLLSKFQLGENIVARYNYASQNYDYFLKLFPDVKENSNAKSLWNWFKVNPTVRGPELINKLEQKNI